MNNHKINIIEKPWGYEYLVYENNDTALWFLYIKNGESTSMHCHPKKTTGLVLLDGEVEVNFLADSRKMKSLDKVMIRRGLYHSTTAKSKNGAFIFEIETPNDKNDLVRLYDKYGRESKPYENSEYEKLKTEECLWINEPDLNNTNHYEFSNCQLTVENINSIDVINEKNDDDLIMFLKGGLIKKIDNTSHCVTIPGDVGFGRIVKMVSKRLDGVLDNTVIITIKK